MSPRYRPLVLCYHALSERWRHALAVPPQTLEAQVRRALARGYRPARADEVVAGDRRLLHVTFDDAYRSIGPALELLERLGVPATVFASTSFADTGAPFAVPELAADAAKLPEELASMDWDGLRALADRGVEVGSHTVSHPRLTQLADDELRRELVESRRRIELELGRACRYLAYPYGDEDDRVRDAAREAGYEAAFALPSAARPADAFGIPRVGVYRGDGRIRFAVKTLPAARRLVLAVR